MIKKKYCFDLDGTLTSSELLPIISKELNLYEEISILTKATIDGLIPFEKSFKLRCKLLSNIPVSRIQEISSSIKLNIQIVEFIKKNSNNCCIITGNIFEWIYPIVKKIGCEVYCSEAEFKNDKMINLKKIINKGMIVNNLKKDNNIIISIGDGMGDVLMFESSDLSVAYGGVHPPIESLIKVSDYLVYDEKSLCTLLETL